MNHDQLKVEPISEPPGSKHPDAIDEYLPKHEFSALMIAPRGSGKTTLMLNMITKFYRGYYHRIIVFSPTMHGDGVSNICLGAEAKAG
jgi:ABC-type branched-subunit amino acid transport system ATPase component